MKQRLSLACAVMALAVLAPGAPAAAEPLPERCSSPQPSASVCVAGDSGLPDPARFTCYGGLHDCDLRVTYGHTGEASAGAEVCADPGYGGGAVCTTTDSGTVPLVAVEEQTVCVGWSLYTSCMPQHDD